MGVAISSEGAKLAPLSFASTLIGFISFSFTLATLFRVFWDSIATFFGAPSEINDMLTNTRQALYEERSNLRRARVTLRRRHASGIKDSDYYVSHRERLTPEDAITAMSTAVKDMIKSFKSYEKPFLVKGLQDPTPRRKRSDKEDGLGYSSGGLGEDEHADYLYATNRYDDCTFAQRFIWIRTKSKVLNLMEGIMRIEVRRIGFQTSHMSLQLRDMMHNFDNLQESFDGLDRIEQRLSRVIGIQRVE